MIKKSVLFVTLAALAAGSYAVVQMVSPESDVVTPKAESYKPCYYTWAYHALPDLSAEFESQVQALDESATAYANAYGEDCTAEDGTSTFGAMETDFYVQLPVSDLADFELFGDWMASVMEVVNSLSPEKIAGPQPGFVEFKFSKNENDFLIVRVPLRDFRERASHLSGAELFNFFYKAP